MRNIYSVLLCSLFCSLFVFPKLSTAQSVIRGPYLQSPGPNSIVIRWRTDSLTDSRVYYGDTLGSMTVYADSATGTTEHRVKINGLSPRTKYYYSVGSSTQVLRGSDPLMHFTTAPDPSISTPVRLMAIGDWGHGNDGEGDVRDAYLDFAANKPADLQLWLGDNVYQDGTDEEFQNKGFDTINGYGKVFLNLPFAPAPGNHDWNSVCAWAQPCNTAPLQQTGPYLDIVDPPTEGELGGVPSHTKLFYSFDYGDIHFISLNSELGSLTPAYNWVGVFNNSTSFTSPMIDWLKADLAATTKKWKIAFWHQCPYSAQDDFTEQSSFQFFTYAARAHFNPHLEQYGVDLVLTGHDHTYQRSYLVNGLYGFKADFNPFMIVNGTSGDADIGEAYIKYTDGPQANRGTVYVIEGNSSSNNGGGPQSNFEHPYIFRGDTCDQCLGSLIVDVVGDRLDAYYLTAYDSIKDHFTILKQAWTGIDENVQAHEYFSIAPNPFNAEINISFALKTKSDAEISVLNLTGQRVINLSLGEREPGKYQQQIDLKDLPAGTYLVRLDAEQTVKYRKVVKTE